MTAPNRGPGYRDHLHSVVAASAGPHGYTLTLWTAGSVTSHTQGGMPGTANALLLLVGAVAAFGLVGALAVGGVGAVIDPPVPLRMRVWGGVHLPAVGLSILLCRLLAGLLHGHAVWISVGFSATATYLLVSGLQVWFATPRQSSPI